MPKPISKPDPAFLDAIAQQRRRARAGGALLTAALALTAVDALVPVESGEVPAPRAAAAEAPPAPAAVDGGWPLFLDPPPPAVPDAAPASEGPVGDATGIPVTVLSAYHRAASLADSRCGLTWQVLAGIGRVESNHARGGDVAVDGTMRTPIYGPVLDGTGGTAAIRYGRGWDRAAGPMQFISSTWAVWGADGSRDGRADAQNVHDAALAAGRYLCAGGTDMSAESGLRSALLRYNHSNSYVDTVVKWINAYRGSGFPVPDGEPAAGSGSTGGGVTARPVSPVAPPPQGPEPPPDEPTPEPEPQPPAPGEDPEPQCPGVPVEDGRPCLLGGVVTGLGEAVTGLGGAVAELLPPLPGAPGITPPPS